jgi:hypothetical protein
MSIFFPSFILFNSFVYMKFLASPSLALPRLAMPSRAQPCLAAPCLVMSIKKNYKGGVPLLVSFVFE